MERIALDAGAGHRRIEKRQIEGGVVTHQHRAPAAMAADGGAHGTEDALQRVALVDRRAQRMPGVDLVDLQRGRIEARVLERPHVIGVRLAAVQPAIRIDLDQHRGDLQQRIGAG